MSPFGRAFAPLAVVLLLTACGPQEVPRPNQGVVVVAVEAGYGAARAGVLPGDILLAASSAEGTTALLAPHHLESLELGYRGSQAVQVTLWRSGVEHRYALPPPPWRWSLRPLLSEGKAPASGDWRLRAWTLQGSGRLAEDAKDYRKATHYYAEAIAATPPDSLWRAALWRLQGDAWFRGGDHDQARASFQKALAAWRARRPDSIWLAPVLIGLGKVARNKSEFDQARRLMEQALKQARGVEPDNPYLARAEQELGTLADWQDKLESAQGHYQRAAAIYGRLGIRDPNFGILRMGLGNLAWQRGDWSTAWRHFHAANEVFRAQAPDSLLHAWSLQGLGLLASLRGEGALAEQRLQQALAILEALQVNRADFALLLGRLGELAWEREDLTGARDYYQRALKILATDYPDSKFVPRARADLGALLIQLGQDEEAGRLLSTALTEWQRLTPGSMDQSNTLFHLGELVTRQGRLAEAQAYHERALAIRARLAPGTAVEATSLHALGVIHESAGQLDKALEFYFRAVAALESQSSRVGGYEQQARFSERYADFYHDLVDLLLKLGRPEAAFDVLERYRARALLAFLDQRRLNLERMLPSGLAARRDALNRRFEAVLNELNGLDAGAAQRARVDALLDELRLLNAGRAAFTSRLRQAAPRAAALEAPRSASLVEIRQWLDVGTAVLSFSVGEDHSHLFVLDSRRALTLFSIPHGASELANDIKRLRLLLESPRSSVAVIRRRAGDLYQRLLAPAESQIAKAERLLILPDGPLHLLPFAVLVRNGGADSEYLVAWKPVHTAASLGSYRELLALREERFSEDASRTPLVAFGDPDYATPTPARVRRLAQGAMPPAARRGSNLTALPASRWEVNAIAALYPKARVYLGGEATERRAKQLEPGVSLAHFATHAVLDRRMPLNSALALSSPAPDAGQDGMLRAWEVIEQLRFEGALVVLSACQTALGESLGGEGLLGLTRAFQLAGARSVLASLWRVEDRASAALMAQFYAGLRNGLSKDRALRAAQLHLLQGPVSLPATGQASWIEGLRRLFGASPKPTRIDAAHPFYWAAFRLSGDWR